MMQGEVRLSRAQAIAQWIYGRIKGRDDLEDYANRAKRLPAMILANGLGLTLAFIRSRGEWSALREDVEAWLKEEFSIGDNVDVLAWIFQQDVSRYRWVTRRALEFAEWLQRISAALREEKRATQAATRSPAD